MMHGPRMLAADHPWWIGGDPETEAHPQDWGSDWTPPSTNSQKNSWWRWPGLTCY